MLAALVEYKYTMALSTVSSYMYGDETEWMKVADGINIAAKPRHKLAAALRFAAHDTLTLDSTELYDVNDMVRSALNNVKYDMGDAMGDANMFFRETPSKSLNHIKAQVEEETIEICKEYWDELDNVPRKYKEQSNED